MAYGCSCLLTMSSYGQCGYLFLVSVLLDQSSTLLTLYNKESSFKPNFGMMSSTNEFVGREKVLDLFHSLTRKKGRKVHTNPEDQQETFVELDSGIHL